jgi:hypothetical protein
LERKREKHEAAGEIVTEHPGYLGALDTYYIGNIKGVGRIYQQTFNDAYSKDAFAKLYDRKNALTAADMLNDQMLPLFEQQQCCWIYFSVRTKLESHLLAGMRKIKKQ